MTGANVSYDTLFAAVYTVVDDWYQEVGGHVVWQRLGVNSRLTNSHAAFVLVDTPDAARQTSRSTGAGGARKGL